MYSGLLGTGMLVGAIAASYSVMTQGSFLLALGIYSLTGTLVVLSAAAVVGLRRTRDETTEETAPEIEKEIPRRAA